MTTCLALAACDPALQGQAIDPARDLPAYTFTRADGSAFDTGPDQGKLTVLFFGYTHCPDICPTTLANWKRVHAGLGADTAKVRFLFVSIDPDRDTPALADQYARGYHPSFIGVSGDAPTVSEMARSFGVAVIPAQEPAGASPVPTGDSASTGAHDHTAPALIGHSSQTFLLNAQGQLIAVYSTDASWQALLSDLRSLQ
jgi:protein SCO1